MVVAISARELLEIAKAIDANSRHQVLLRVPRQVNDRTGERAVTVASLDSGSKALGLLMPCLVGGDRLAELKTK